jgi:peptidoglycan/LPS O-acetylase OafA/YrhL
VALIDQCLVVGSGLALTAVLAAENRAARVLRILAPVGVISYGIYLWHWVILGILEGHGMIRISWWFSEPSWLLATLILFALTIPIAAASWLFVERPAIRWSSRRVRRFS